MTFQKDTNPIHLFLLALFRTSHVEKAEVAVDTVALLIESNLVGYSPTTGQAARDGQVPPMAFVCIRTHFDEDSVTLFLLYSFFFLTMWPNSPRITKIHRFAQKATVTMYQSV